MAPLEPERVAEVAATLRVPGRLEQLADAPPTFVDVAHNPDGARALAEALPEVARGLPVVAVLAVLADKDAQGIVAALAPVLDRVVCTELPGPRPSTPAVPAGGHLRGVGLPAAAEPDLATALARARGIAAEPPPGAVVVTGSHYVLGPARAALS